MTNTQDTITPAAIAAGSKLAAALSAVTTADGSFRQAQGLALPALADSYVKFAAAGIAAVIACGVSVAADSDASAIGKAVREARDTIAADAVGDAGALRDLLASLTGVGAANGSRWSRAIAVRNAIGKADGSGARAADVKRFVSLHIDRDDVTIGIAMLAKWCGAGAADALPTATRQSPNAGDADSSDAGSSTTGSTTGAGAGSSAAVPTAPMALAQAVEAMHRGSDDASLEAVIAAAPIDVAALPDDVASALLAALLASVEMARRADASIDAPAPLAALAALATAGK